MGGVLLVAPFGEMAGCVQPTPYNSSAKIQMCRSSNGRTARWSLLKTMWKVYWTLCAGGGRALK